MNTEIQNDPVLSAFPDAVNQFIQKGYTFSIDSSKQQQLHASTYVLLKRIYVLDQKTGEEKRAYSIRVTFFSYLEFQKYQSSNLPKFGVEYLAIIDSGGPDQMEVSFGQNETCVNIEEAENRFLRVFNGIGQPFYQG